MNRISGQQNKSVITVVVVVCVVGLIFQSLPESLQIELRYDRNQPTQAWRFITGHLLHLGWVHLLFNLVGLALITTLFLPEWKMASFICAFLCSGVVINLCMFIFSPDLVWYVGLSGVLHGLIAAGAVYSYRLQPKFALLVLIGVAVKIGWEQLTGSSVGTEQLIGGKVAFDAHMYGFIGGLVGSVLFLFVSRSTATPK